MAEPLPAATNAELEILGVLWELDASEALRLGEIHERVGQRRRAAGQSAPAITTVSSMLRGALAKGLLVEVRKSGDSVAAAPKAGAKSLVTTRSPQTAYRAAHTPSELLGPLLGMYAGLYPPTDRYRPVLDLLAELGYADEVAAKIETVLKKAAS